MPAPRIDVDLDAVRHNVRTFAEAAGRPVLAVVKANAYGHGAVPVARAALEAGASSLGVVDVAEGVALREAGVEAPILTWIHGPATTWEEAFDADLALALSSLEQLDAVAESAAAWRARSGDAWRGPVGVQIKVDTGLGRNGVPESAWPAVFARGAELERSGDLRVNGLLSHLSGASAEDDAAQRDAFRRAERAARAAGLDLSVRHLSATAGALGLPDGGFDLVRLGIAMYGLSPFAPGRDVGADLRPALRLVAPVTRHAAAHGSACWAVEVGSAHGLPPLTGPLELADTDGGRWRVVAVEDCRTIVEPVAPPTRAGATADGTEPDGADEAEGPTLVRDLVVIGDGSASEPGADAWAEAAGTINYEIVTRLHPTLPRRLLGEAGAHHGRHAVDHAADGRWADVTGARRGDAPVTAPIRRLVVDLAELDRRLRAGGIARLDVSADAFGLGLADVVPLAVASGVPLVVRTAVDAAAVERLTGERPPIDPAGGDDALAAYGFTGDQPPVVSLRSELVLVKPVPAGQGVSYGYTWTAPEATTLGLVPLGYGDGVVRRVGGSAFFLVDGAPRPIVGRVAMDQVVVDLGGATPATGAEVVLFGPDDGAPALAEWASWAGITPEAVVASLGPRVDRVPGPVRA